MLAMVLLTLVLVSTCVYAVWPGSAGSPGTAGGPGRIEKAKAAAAVRLPETLEGTLARQLIDHEITGRQYERAMEQLAARDDDRHPLSVPPETGLADGG